MTAAGPDRPDRPGRPGVLDGALVGRGTECGVILEMLSVGHADAAGVLLEGSAGAGKTTLWRWGMAQADGRGMTVLAATGAELEVSASFACQSAASCEKCLAISGVSCQVLRVAMSNWPGKSPKSAASAWKAWTKF